MSVKQLQTLLIANQCPRVKCSLNMMFERPTKFMDSLMSKITNFPEKLPLHWPLSSAPGQVQGRRCTYYCICVFVLFYYLLYIFHSNLFIFNATGREKCWKFRERYLVKLLFSEASTIGEATPQCFLRYYNTNYRNNRTTKGYVSYCNICEHKIG